MHISRIEIINFRNFKRLVIDELGPASVFVGENGIGKSNLLHAIRLVLDPHLPDSGRRLKREDFWEEVDEGPFGGAEIRVALDLTDYEDDERASGLLYDSQISADPPTARLVYVFRPAASIEGSPSGARDYEFALLSGPEEHSVSPAVRRHITLRFLMALRDAEGDLQNWARSPLRQLLERLEIGDERLEEIADAIRDATNELAAEPSVKELGERIAQRMLAIAGKVFAVDTALGFAAMRADQIIRAIRIFVDGARNRSLSETSLGTLNLLYLTLLLEDLEQQREHKEVVSTVLAVEEPEAHLHPHLQRVIFRHLLREQDPLLLTTHSPHIASVAPLNSLVLLRKEPGQGTVSYTMHRSGLEPQEVRDIERYLDVTRAEMLFAKGVILVEGVAELFIVPAFATALGWHLDEYGVTVCSVHGTDFGPYVKLLGPNGLNIPHVIITDGDAHLTDAEDDVSEGAKRARRLLPPKAAKKAKEALDADDHETLMNILNDNDIYVGPTTLEADLLPDAADAIKQTYAALGPTGPVAQKNFAAAVDGVPKGDAKHFKGFMSRIEAIGKGRFAQRLAEELEKDMVPPHIYAAIERIVQVVGGTDVDSE